MRMKFNKSVSLLAASLVTACGTLTVDFVYVTCAKAAGPNNYGEVDVFEVNSESGHMRQIPTSPFPSAGRNPVAEAVSVDNANLYVINEDDNTIVQFVIGNDGKLYPQNTVNTPGVFPLAVAVTQSDLYVVDTYQPLPTCSTVAPCSGSVAVFPLDSTDAPQAPLANGNLNYWPLNLPGSSDVLTPTAITLADSGAYAYVSAYDAKAGAGYIFAFAVNSGGTLSPLNGGVPFAAGVQPSAVASPSGGGYLYVADAAQNEIIAFQINNGLLTPLPGSPFASGLTPGAIAIDASGKYAYVANSQDSNVTAYSISSGALVRLGSYATGTQPVAIGIDPSLNQYLYTANFLGNTVSGFQLSATDGSLLISQGSPFTANAQPTAVAAIPHGSQKK
jgi:6-phosphogluconolactonase (cycloisomerase 2 family)